MYGIFTYMNAFFFSMVFNGFHVGKIYYTRIYMDPMGFRLFSKSKKTVTPTSSSTLMVDPVDPCKTRSQEKEVRHSEKKSCEITKNWIPSSKCHFFMFKGYVWSIYWSFRIHLFLDGVCVCVCCVFDSPKTLELPIKELPIDIYYRYTLPTWFHGTGIFTYMNGWFVMINVGHIICHTWILHYHLVGNWASVWTGTRNCQVHLPSEISHQKWWKTRIHQDRSLRMGEL